MAKTRELQRRQIIDFLESDVLPPDDKSARKISLTSENFYLDKDGLLNHLDRSNKRSARDGFSQLVIPQSMKFEVLSNAHNYVSGGHFGVHKKDLQ